MHQNVEPTLPYYVGEAVPLIVPDCEHERTTVYCIGRFGWTGIRMVPMYANSRRCKLCTPAQATQSRHIDEQNVGTDKMRYAAGLASNFCDVAEYHRKISPRPDFTIDILVTVSLVRT